MRRLCAALLALVAVALTVFMHPSLAKEAMPIADDPALEARVMHLADELRCLVCQNQTIADSQASLAIDLKNQVREQLRQGRSDKEVIDYMVKRYGDFVLYRPPLKVTTWLLWGGPFLLIFGGAGVLIYSLAKRRTQVKEVPLSDDERQRAHALLHADSGKEAR
ncbi:MAG: cytochrome c-type biogenesis protein [Burkholderiales bacterium]